MSQAICRISCSAPTSCCTPARALSGGERNRLLLARLFAQPANLLVLDEPTNDLDIDTLELLQELVAEFSGTLLLVSHDRAFLDNVVTSLLVLEGDGRVQDFVGGYGDWARWRDARDAAQAAADTAASARRTDQCRARHRAAVRHAASSPTRSSANWPNCRRRLEALEAAQGAARSARLQDPAFYARAARARLPQAWRRWRDLDAGNRGGLRALGGTGGQVNGGRDDRSRGAGRSAATCCAPAA